MAKDEQYHRENSPIFSLRPTGNYTRKQEITIFNGGGAAHSLKISTPPKGSSGHYFDNPVLLDHHSFIKLYFDFGVNVDATKLKKILFTLSYVDYLGDRIEREMGIEK